MSVRKNTYFDVGEVVQYCNDNFLKNLNIVTQKSVVNIYNNIKNDYSGLYHLGYSIGVITKRKDIDIVNIDRYLYFSFDYAADVISIDITAPSVESLFKALDFLNKDSLTFGAHDYAIFNGNPVKAKMLIPPKLKLILLFGYYTYYFSELS